MQTIRYLIATILAAFASLFGIAGIVVHKFFDIEITVGSFGEKYLNSNFLMTVEAGDRAYLSDYIATAWIWLTIITYICGGLITAIKMAVEFALKGLIVPPPFSLLAVPLMGLLAIVFYIFIPILPVLRAMSTYA